MNKIRIAGLALLGILAAGQGPAQAQAPDLSRLRPRVEPVSAEAIAKANAQSGLTNCFWAATVSPTTLNILIPDSGVVYWAAQFALPPGASLGLTGEYPHARYMSFASYDAAGQPIDSLNDQMNADTTAAAEGLGSPSKNLLSVVPTRMLKRASRSAAQTA